MECFSICIRIATVDNCAICCGTYNINSIIISIGFTRISHGNTRGIVRHGIIKYPIISFCVFVPNLNRIDIAGNISAPCQYFLSHGRFRLLHTCNNGVVGYNSLNIPLAASFCNRCKGRIDNATLADIPVLLVTVIHVKICAACNIERSVYPKRCIFRRFCAFKANSPTNRSDCKFINNYAARPRAEGYGNIAVLTNNPCTAGIRRVCTVCISRKRPYIIKNIKGTFVILPFRRSGRRITCGIEHIC